MFFSKNRYSTSNSSSNMRQQFQHDFDDGYDEMMRAKQEQGSPADEEVKVGFYENHCPQLFERPTFDSKFGPRIFEELPPIDDNMTPEDSERAIREFNERTKKHLNNYQENSDESYYSKSDEESDSADVSVSKERLLLESEVELLAKHGRVYVFSEGSLLPFNENLEELYQYGFVTLFLYRGKYTFTDNPDEFKQAGHRLVFEAITNENPTVEFNSSKPSTTISIDQDIADLKLQNKALKDALESCRKTLQKNDNKISSLKSQLADEREKCEEISFVRDHEIYEQDDSAVLRSKVDEYEKELAICKESLTEANLEIENQKEEILVRDEEIQLMKHEVSFYITAFGDSEKNHLIEKEADEKKIEFLNNVLGHNKNELQLNVLELENQTAALYESEKKCSFYYNESVDNQLKFDQAAENFEIIKIQFYEFRQGLDTVLESHEKITEELDGCKNDLSVSQYELKEKCEQLIDCQETVRSISKELNDCQNKLSETQIENFERLHNDEEVTNDITAELDSCKRQLIESKGQVNEKNRLLKNCQESLKWIKRELNECRESLNELQSKNNGQLTGCQQNVEKVTEELKACKNKLSELQNELNMKSKQLIECQETIKKITDDCDEFKKELDNNKTKSSNSIKANQEKSVQLEVFQLNLMVSKQQIQNLTEELASEKKVASEYLKLHQSAANEIEELKLELSDEKKQFEINKKQLEQTKDKLKEKNKNYEETIEITGTLKVKIEELSRNYDSAYQSIQKYKVEVQEYEKQLRSFEYMNNHYDLLLSEKQMNDEKLSAAEKHNQKLMIELDLTTKQLIQSTEANNRNDAELNLIKSEFMNEKNKCKEGKEQLLQKQIQCQDLDQCIRKLKEELMNNVKHNEEMKLELQETKNQTQNILEEIKITTKNLNNEIKLAKENQNLLETAQGESETVKRDLNISQENLKTISIESEKLKFDLNQSKQYALKLTNELEANRIDMIEIMTDYGVAKEELSIHTKNSLKREEQVIIIQKNLEDSVDKIAVLEKSNEELINLLRNEKAELLKKTIELDNASVELNASNDLLLKEKDIVKRYDNELKIIDQKLLLAEKDKSEIARELVDANEKLTNEVKNTETVRKDLEICNVKLETIQANYSLLENDRLLILSQKQSVEDVAKDLKSTLTDAQNNLVEITKDFNNKSFELEVANKNTEEANEKLVKFEEKLIASEVQTKLQINNYDNKIRILEDQQKELETFKSNYYQLKSAKSDFAYLASRYIAEKKKLLEENTLLRNQNCNYFAIINDTALNNDEINKMYQNLEVANNALVKKNKKLTMDCEHYINMSDELELQNHYFITKLEKYNKNNQLMFAQKLELEQCQSSLQKAKSQLTTLCDKAEASEMKASEIEEKYQKLSKDYNSICADFGSHKCKLTGGHKTGEKYRIENTRLNFKFQLLNNETVKQHLEMVDEKKKSNNLLLINSELKDELEITKNLLIKTAELLVNSEKSIENFIDYNIETYYNHEEERERLMEQIRCAEDSRMAQQIQMEEQNIYLRRLKRELLVT